MFTNTSGNCIAGCGIDSTPCPNGIQNEYMNYPAYGLEGTTFEGFSYLSDTGARIDYKPADDGKFYINDQMLTFTHDGSPIPMFNTMLESPSAVPALLYDVTELNKLYDPETSGPLPLNAPTFKAIKGIQVGLGRDGLSFVWGEFNPERPVMYIYKTVKNITADSVNVKYYLCDKRGLPIDFNHPKYKDLVNVNSRLRIERHDPKEVLTDNCGTYGCCADPVVRPVVAMGQDQLSRPSNFGGTAMYPYVIFEGAGNGTDGVNRPLFTVTGRSSVDGASIAYNENYVCLNNPDKYADGTYPGDQVTFEYSSFDWCKPVTGGYQTQGYIMKQSFAQNIGAEITFEDHEIRRGYPEVGGIDVVIGRRFQGTARYLIEQMYRAFWLGENRRPNNASSIPGSTMGLLTELYAAHAAKPWLRIVRSAMNTVTLEDKARLFLDCLEQVQRHKVTGSSGTITAVMDQAALSCYTYLRGAFKKLGGWQEMLPNANNFSFGDMYTISTPWGKLELMTDIYLEQISGNSGMVVFLNRDLIGTATLPEFTIELPSNNVKQNVVQGFKLKKTSPDNIVGECKSYVLYTTFSFIFPYIGAEGTNPYLILEGFAV